MMKLNFSLQGLAEELETGKHELVERMTACLSERRRIVNERMGSINNETYNELEKLITCAEMKINDVYRADEIKDFIPVEDEDKSYAEKLFISFMNYINLIDRLSKEEA